MLHQPTSMCDMVCVTNHPILPLVLDRIFKMILLEPLCYVQY